MSTILNYFESKLFNRDGPFIKNISVVKTRKKNILINVHLDRTLLTRNSWKKLWYINDIYNIARLDWLEHSICSIISSQRCFIEMDLSWKMFFFLKHKKKVIHSKLVNNPLKDYSEFENNSTRSDACFYSFLYHLDIYSNSFSLLPSKLNG